MLGCDRRFALQANSAAQFIRYIVGRPRSQIGTSSTTLQQVGKQLLVSLHVSPLCGMMASGTNWRESWLPSCLLSVQATPAITSTPTMNSVPAASFSRLHATHHIPSHQCEQQMAKYGQIPRINWLY
jgi:hypothetical protein